jgi:hypothetical protein
VTRQLAVRVPKHEGRIEDAAFLLRVVIAILAAFAVQDRRRYRSCW